MFIQIEATPNPATMKFLPGCPVLLSGTMEFLDADTSASSPLASALFAIDGVTGIFFGSDFVTISKDDTHEWQHLRPIVLCSIMEHFMSGAPLLNDSSMRCETTRDEEFDAVDEQIVSAIKELLETRVRPAVAQDGGDILFQGYRHGIVFLHMRGACAGCPSSEATLKNGIENLLRHFIPEVQEVRAV